MGPWFLKRETSEPPRCRIQVMLSPRCSCFRWRWCNWSPWAWVPQIFGGSMFYWLVVTGAWLDYFPIQLGIIIPIDELIFFRGVETTNQFIFSLFFWMNPPAIIGNGHELTGVMVIQWYTIFVLPMARKISDLAVLHPPPGLPVPAMVRSLDGHAAYSDVRSVVSTSFSGTSHVDQWSEEVSPLSRRSDVFLL